MNNLNQASPVDVAKTMMHDSIHADLKYYVVVVKANDDILIDDFRGITDFWSRDKKIGYMSKWALFIGI